MIYFKNVILKSIFVADTKYMKGKYKYFQHATRLRLSTFPFHRGNTESSFCLDAGLSHRKDLTWVLLQAHSYYMSECYN